MLLLPDNYAPSYFQEFMVIKVVIVVTQESGSLSHSGLALERGVLFTLPPCFSLAPVNFLSDEITSNSSLKVSLISILTLNKMSITILLSHCSWQTRHPIAAETA